MSDPNPETSRGFVGRNGMRLLMATCVATLIIGAAVPAARRGEIMEQADATIDLIETVERGAQRHRADTGALAIEIAAPDANSAYVGATFHRLGMRQSYPGWNGPYLPHPLTMAHNPFGGSIALRSRPEDVTPMGFALEGAGPFGQYLVLDEIPRNVARLVELRFDGEATDADGLRNWSGSGRVRWNESDSRLLVILDVDLP
ncbi:MAG: hypothetical protein R3F20_14470 [Planctomycetota bacterium]